MNSGAIPEGKGAWNEQGEPWVRRQMVQLQRCTFNGRTSVARVRVYCTLLQRQAAVRVLVGVEVEVEAISSLLL